MSKGWVKLHRKMADHPLWLSEPFTRAQAWVDLIMLANHADGFVRVRGVRVDVPRGSLGWSEARLATRWRWSRGKARRFLRELETVQQIVQQKNNATSVISITNYDEYQQDGTADGTADGQQTVQQTDTNKNVKKKKKNNKYNTFTPPTTAEVADYVADRTAQGKPRVDAFAFVDHYTSKGWMIGKNKMKDWKAAVRTWERNSNDTGQPEFYN